MRQARRSTAAVGLALLAGVLGCASVGGAQEGWNVQAGGDACDGRSFSRDRDRFCEVRERTFAAAGELDVDGGPNGGVTVVGWDRNEVHVRARVQVWARDEDRAAELAREVEIRMEGGRLVADGPDTDRRESWGVSFELQVPRQSDLRVRTVNGGIRVADMGGELDLSAVNGGLRLEAVSGDVRGRTQNGGVRVALTGDRWQGRGLDVETTNGGVDLVVPSGYSAELETGTVNGGIELDFPVTVQGRIGRRIRTTLGDGGPTVRVATTNGGVRVMRR